MAEGGYLAVCRFRAPEFFLHPLPCVPSGKLGAMRLWGSVSRHCAPCYTNEAWRVVARRHASSRSRIEVAREEHAENVRWSKQEEARAILEPPPFDEDGATVDEGALESLDAYLQVRLFCIESSSLAPSSSANCTPYTRTQHL